MSPAFIAAAKMEAQRFIDRADRALAEARDGYLRHGKDTGALRRTSLELTRALAEMRKPG